MAGIKTLGACLAVGLATACVQPDALGGGRLTLGCIVKVTATTAGVTQDVGVVQRVLWLDRDAGLYALSELGGTGVDQDWLANAAAAPGFREGMVPFSGAAHGAFVCLARSADGACVQGVDVASGAYVFASPFTASSPEGVRSGVLRGTGECAPDAKTPWLLDAGADR